MVDYKRFWKILDEKGISQYDLIHREHVSSRLLYKLRHNMYVSSRTIDRLCGILACKAEEIMELCEDDNEVY